MRVVRCRWVTGALVLALSVTAACSGGSSSSSSTTPKPERIVYVALGDSYSSGEGAPPYLHDAADPASCQRSTGGWAARLAKDVDTVVAFTQRACSSATTAFMTGPWASRNLPAQIPASPDPTVTLVTFTIGGNDLGFGGIVADCYLLDCSAVPANGLFTTGLGQLLEHLSTSVYPALRQAYPNARIVQVGYPRLTPAVGRPVQGCAWLTAKEQAAGALIVAELDDTIRAASRRSLRPGGAKVQFVNATNALRGHELCSASPWIQPVTIGGAAAAHPTAAGQQAIEHAVIGALALPVHEP